MKGLNSIMKIKLPNGEKIILKDHIEYKEREKEVNKLLKEWKDIIRADSKTWLSNSIKYFLDSLSNYLLWSKKDNKKEELKKEDTILTKRQTIIMNRKSGDERREMPVSNMSQINEFKEDDRKRREMKREIREEVKRSKNEVSEVIVYYEEEQTH